MLVPVYDIMNCGPRSRFVANGKVVHNSKGGAINMQNLKRGSFLRKAIMAPPGHVMGVGDLSQIEPRVLAWLSDYDELLDIFRMGGDPYATFGAQMFQIPGMTKESHPVQRQSAKSALLGAGYMLGWASFAAQLLTGFLGAPPKRYTQAEAKALGVTRDAAEKFLSWDENVRKMAEIPHTCTDAELLYHCLAAKAIIDRYRATAEPVVDFWELLGHLIEYSLYKGTEYTHKCLTFRKGEIILPSGMPIRYPDLRPGEDEKGRVQWTYADGKKRVKLYAGKVCNNCLAAGTLVLTLRGWVPIENVEPQDLVHDGVEFVPHAGKILTGVQGCVTVDGVLITPEHLVLTEHGWEAASQVQEPFRPYLRHVDGVAPRNVNGHRENYAVQPAQIGLAGGASNAAALVQQQVYDIVNCGPRNRFVVKGTRGPFIVHNCVQGTARCVMTDGMLRVDKRYPVVGTVHDELLAVVPAEEADEAKTWVLAQMVMVPNYLPGIPLNAEVGVNERYGLAKS